ncbi:MAG TPA: 30S ribosomal protein S17 [Planctomycetota bacterium]|jgi:small subunit ribosomal protein S17|nr:30S ribosomal protein S17 [Planctomycetota bacterium]
MTPKSTAAPPARPTRKKVVGRVVSDKMNKTIVVQVERIVQDPRFGKYLKKYSKCYAHDEKREAKRGDRVEISETRPLSKLKRWRLVKILEKGAVETVAAVPAPAEPKA